MPHLPRYAPAFTGKGAFESNRLGQEVFSPPPLQKNTGKACVSYHMKCAFSPSLGRVRLSELCSDQQVQKGVGLKALFPILCAVALSVIQDIG